MIFLLLLLVLFYVILLHTLCSLLSIGFVVWNSLLCSNFYFIFYCETFPDSGTSCVTHASSWLWNAWLLKAVPVSQYSAGSMCSKLRLLSHSQVWSWSYSVVWMEKVNTDLFKLGWICLHLNCLSWLNAFMHQWVIQICDLSVSDSSKCSSVWLQCFLLQ